MITSALNNPVTTGGMHDAMQLLNVVSDTERYKDRLSAITKAEAKINKSLVAFGIGKDVVKARDAANAKLEQAEQTLTDANLKAKEILRLSQYKSDTVREGLDYERKELEKFDERLKGEMIAIKKEHNDCLITSKKLDVRTDKVEKYEDRVAKEYAKFKAHRKVLKDALDKIGDV